MICPRCSFLLRRYSRRVAEFLTHPPVEYMEAMGYDKTNAGSPRTATRGCALSSRSAATSAAHVRRSEIARPTLVKRAAVVGPAHASDSGSFETLHAVHARLGHVKGRACRPPHHDDAHARPVHTVARRVMLETSQNAHFGVHSGNVDRGTQERVSVIRRRDVVVERAADTLVVESVRDVYRRILGAHMVIY